MDLTCSQTGFSEKGKKGQQNNFRLDSVMESRRESSNLFSEKRADLVLDIQTVLGTKSHQNTGSGSA